MASQVCAPFNIWNRQTYDFRFSSAAMLPPHRSKVPSLLHHAEEIAAWLPDTTAYRRARPASASRSANRAASPSMACPVRQPNGPQPYRPDEQIQIHDQRRHVGKVDQAGAQRQQVQSGRGVVVPGLPFQTKPTLSRSVRRCVAQYATRSAAPCSPSCRWRLSSVGSGSA